MNNMEMIECIKCKGDMPKLRLEKYGYKLCVNCSNVSSYKAVTTTNGEGDHTWNDIHITTESELENYNSVEVKFDNLDEIDNLDVEEE